MTLSDIFSQFDSPLSLFQLIGWCAVGFYMISFQILDPKKTIACWIPADLLMSIHYYGLNSLTSCAMALGASVRNISTVFAAKKYIPFIVIIYLIYLWAAAFYLSLHFYDIAIATGATFTTLSMLARDHFWAHRSLMLTSNLCFLSGFYLMGSYPGIVNVIFVMSSNVIGIVRKIKHDAHTPEI